MGLFAVGGLTMLIQGFAPIYVTAEGYSKDEVALLLFLMQFGMIAVQYPLGALSDRIDRRSVLIAASLLVLAMAAVASHMDTEAFWWVVLIFAVWTGATESIYAIANAHANDRADPEYYVSLTSTLLIAWSVSGLILPAIATALTPILGPKAFMTLALVIAASYSVFVLFRVFRREATSEAKSEPYQQISSQAPLSAELAPQPSEE